MRNCARCGELLPLDAFYFVSRKLGTRRGQCKSCMAEVKAAQRDPAWLPTCARCGRERPRSGPGRRLCGECFASIYDAEAERKNGAHRLKLNPCSACGAVRLRVDHVSGTSLCPICRGVPQPRRVSLKRDFNMTPREYVDLLAAQGGVCAICGGKPRKGFHIDHRHGDTPIVRGIVCNSCNTMLGLARDDPERLREAARYLDAPPAQVVLPGRLANNRPGAWHKLTRVAA